VPFLEKDLLAIMSASTRRAATRFRAGAVPHHVVNVRRTPRKRPYEAVHLRSGLLSRSSPTRSPEVRHLRRAAQVISAKSKSDAEHPGPPTGIDVLDMCVMNQMCCDGDPFGGTACVEALFNAGPSDGENSKTTRDAVPPVLGRQAPRSGKKAKNWSTADAACTATAALRASSGARYIALGVSVDAQSVRFSDGSSSHRRDLCAARLDVSDCSLFRARHPCPSHRGGRRYGCSHRRGARSGDQHCKAYQPIDLSARYILGRSLARPRFDDTSRRAPRARLRGEQRQEAREPSQWLRSMLERTVLLGFPRVGWRATDCSQFPDCSSFAGTARGGSDFRAQHLAAARRLAKIRPDLHPRSPRWSKPSARAIGGVSGARSQWRER